MGLILVAVWSWMSKTNTNESSAIRAEILQYQTDCNSSMIATQTNAEAQAKELGEQAYREYLHVHLNDPCRLLAVTASVHHTYGTRGSDHYSVRTIRDDDTNRHDIILSRSEDMQSVSTDHASPAYLEIWGNHFTAVYIWGNRYMTQRNPASELTQNDREGIKLGVVGIVGMCTFLCGIIPMMAAAAKRFRH